MKLTMQLGARSYDIIVRRGTLAKANQLANLNRKVLVVSDDGVPDSYVKTILSQCKEGHTMVVKQGEGSKSPETWRLLLSRMLELEFGRGDAVAAVGGGVVGDLAGFAASSYMRGISYFQFPTTTLSQIDSSIGGKVAINLDGIKNCVGAFYQPELVIADPDTLDTLPSRHYSNGLAEALKAGLLGSTELFELMEKGTFKEDIERILYLALRYKKSVVELDETEQGERKLLNFGHTIGHGIEAAGGLHGLLHGECVALGMLPMIESQTLLRRTRSVMRSLSLPLKNPHTPQQMVQYMRSDKKREQNTYTIVRVKKLGHGYLEKVDFEELCLLAGLKEEKENE